MPVRGCESGKAGGGEGGQLQGVSGACRIVHGGSEVVSAEGTASQEADGQWQGSLGGLQIYSRVAAACGARLSRPLCWRRDLSSLKVATRRVNQ